MTKKEFKTEIRQETGSTSKDTARVGSLRNVAMIFVCFALVTMFSGCEKEEPTSNNSNNQAVPEGGVLINGVVWAKCNVDVPGTFTTMPENSGMFYQWNRKKILECN